MIALLDGDTLRDGIRRELESGWPGADPASVQFLASGEYTLNYRFAIGDREAVLRIVTGSQMGLEVAEQALYEADALDILAASSKVPELIGVEPEPKALDYPYLLVEYLPGRPLDYTTDLERAARTVAAVHSLEPPLGHRLQLHIDPVSSILDESRDLLSYLPASEGGADSDWNAVRSLFQRVEGTPPEAFDAVRSDPVIINSDLNPHNFIVDERHVWLIDWEKARIAPSLMDIAHFLLPTTTLWRESTATRLTRDQRKRFIDAYLAARQGLDGIAYRKSLRPALQLAALRAVSWCAWAIVASQEGQRSIQNEETLAKCRLFTSHEFLDELIAELWN